MNNYPLEQIIHIKKRRFDEAVKILEQKKELLEKAYEKLFDVTEEFNKAETLRQAKLLQLRTSMDEGTTTDKIIQMKDYLKTCTEEAKEKKKKVDDAQKKVDDAQQAVDTATDDLFQKKKDLEKLELHKKEWQKEDNYLTEQKDQLEQDEQGSTSFNRSQREKKLRSQGDKS